MSTTIKSALADAYTAPYEDGAASQVPAKESPVPVRYKGFVAGIFSGVTKLAVGHPFDTIKVRLQTSSRTQFRGPLDCLVQTLRNEGARSLYKGASPPLVGWMAMDSIMLGSLTLYRRLLEEHVFANSAWHPQSARKAHARQELPPFGHGLAGILAGCTVSSIAAPVEHVKARLQTQYQARKADRLYKGPIDCLRRVFQAHGVRGVYHGVGATMVFRSFFFFWWSSYDILTKALSNNTALSTVSVNFWAGGLSAQLFWLTAYPTDVVKQRIMTDPLGGGLNDGQRRFRSWWQAVNAVRVEAGWRGYWRGFTPCFLRAFPANAMALVVFERLMRTLPG